MAASQTDALWALMRQGEYYSVRDLANVSDQPGSTVTEVVRFLAKYGFVDAIGAGQLFTKSSLKFSPGESVNLLRCIANS